MNYQVVPLEGQEQFDLNGVRFDGKIFMFWKKKSTREVKQIVIIFDKKHEGIQLRDGMMVLSLKGLNNYQDLRNAIRILLQILGKEKLDVQLQFVVENGNQRQEAEALGREFGLSYVVQDVNNNQNQNLKAMEEQLKKSTNSDFSAGGNQIIDKYDNGTLKQITVYNGVAYENNGLLNSEEEKLSLLREWMQDPVKAQELMRLSEEERNDLLSREVLSNRKQYKLEEANQQVAYDKAGETAINVAEREGGLVNAELNVVQHDVTRDNQYSTVERNGENVQVVNPSVAQTNVSTSGGVFSGESTTSGASDFQNYEEPTMSMEEQQERELVEQVFFVDEEGNIFNNNADIIGKLGNDGYRINYEDNSLVRYDKIVGYIGDYNDMGKTTNNTHSKPNVRTLKKENNRSVGFVSLPVIMFVLSALLLIGSVILLFVLE